jgi:hypothetical protein
MNDSGVYGKRNTTGGRGSAVRRSNKLADDVGAQYPDLLNVE